MAEFKTLQFPDTPAGHLEKTRSLTREARAGWKLVSETLGARINVTLQRDGAPPPDQAPPTPSGFTAAEWLDRDTALREAANIVVRSPTASPTMLQREMMIGYGRAAKLITELEKAGILQSSSRMKDWRVVARAEDLDRILGA